MLQWLRLYTLGSRGSQEIKTFLEIHLITFTNRSKVEQEGRIHAFKGKFCPKIVADWWGCGSGLMASWERFPSAVSWLPIWQWISFDFASTEATIAPRSGHDRASIVTLVLNRSPSDLVGRSEALIPRWRRPWSHLIMATIARRSGHDRASNWVLIFSLSDEDHDLMKMWRARELHSLPVWWRSDIPESSTHRQGEMKIGANCGHLIEIRWSQCVHAVLPDPKSRKIAIVRWSHVRSRCFWFNEDRTLLATPLGSTQSPSSWWNPMPIVRPRRRKR